VQLMTASGDIIVNSCRIWCTHVWMSSLASSQATCLLTCMCRPWGLIFGSGRGLWQVHTHVDRVHRWVMDKCGQTEYSWGRGKAESPAAPALPSDRPVMGCNHCTFT
jgi:hypothetical protein